MNFQEEFRPYIKDKRQLERYLRFISLCSIHNDINPPSVYCENHHILPRALFPQYIKTNENIITLTGRQHFLAHWMLAKAIKDKSCWFAFNQMRRLFGNSILYEYGRSEISKAISKTNKGRRRTQAFKDEVAKRFRNKLRAKLPNDTTVFWTTKNDPRWETGEIIPAALGNKHTDKTKKKIGDANRGRTFFINEQGVIRMFVDGAQPSGFIPYQNPQWFEATCLNTSWYYDPISGEQTRIQKGDIIPYGYIKGRNPEKHNAWDIVNSMTQVIDVYERDYKRVTPDQITEQDYLMSGPALDTLLVMVHNNMVVIGYTDMLLYLESKGIPIDRADIKRGSIGNPHFNNTPSKKQFREKHKGKDLQELGITITPLLEFQMDKSYKLWRKK